MLEAAKVARRVSLTLALRAVRTQVTIVEADIHHGTANRGGAAVAAGRRGGEFLDDAAPFFSALVGILDELFWKEFLEWLL